MKYPRITVNPSVMGGVPCVRSLRIPVATIIKLMAEGKTRNEVLALYPDLQSSDLDEALAYAAGALEEREITLAS